MQCITIVFLMQCFWSVECSIWNDSLFSIQYIDKDITSTISQDMYAEDVMCTSFVAHF